MSISHRLAVVSSYRHDDALLILQRQPRPHQWRLLLWVAMVVAAAAVAVVVVVVGP